LGESASSATAPTRRPLHLASGRLCSSAKMTGQLGRVVDRHLLKIAASVCTGGSGMSSFPTGQLRLSRLAFRHSSPSSSAVPSAARCFIRYGSAPHPPDPPYLPCSIRDKILNIILKSEQVRSKSQPDPRNAALSRDFTIASRVFTIDVRFGMS